MDFQTAWVLFWSAVSVGLLLFVLIAFGPERYKEWRSERQQKGKLQ